MFEKYSLRSLENRYERRKTGEKHYTLIHPSADARIDLELRVKAKENIDEYGRQGPPPQYDVTEKKKGSEYTKQPEQQQTELE
jgi:hypothetical protein